VVHIEPSEPRTDDDITVVVDSPTDSATENGSTYSYAWYRDGEAWSGSLATVPASQTARDQVWTVEVSPVGSSDPTQVGTASVVIANTPPTVSSLRVTPSSPFVDDDLALAFELSDRDDDAVTTAITWTVDGAEVTDLIGATGVPSSYLARGQVWTAQVVPSDHDDAGDPGSTSVTIGNRAPSLTSVSLSPSGAQVGDTLVASASGTYDPEGDAVSVIFDWYVGASMVLESTETDGSSSLSGLFSKGDLVYVVATPTDGTAAGASFTSTSLTITNTAPTLDTVALDPTEGGEGTTFTCVPGTSADADGDTVSIDYAWTVNGSASPVTTSTMDGSAFRKNDRISCTATPFDGTDAGGAATSDTVTISNTAPSIADVSLSPDTPTESTGISTHISGASDPDGDSISYGYAWYVNGALVGSTSSSLSSSYYQRDDEVLVVVTPRDATDSGTPVSSAAVRIGNALPSISGVSLSPSSPTTGSTLTCTPSGWSDADGDAASYAYAWTVDGTAVTGATSTTLDGATAFDRDQRVVCTVTPNDGIDSGAARSSSSVTIRNSPPGDVVDIATGTTAQECDEIVLDASSSTDADEDPLSFAWTIQSEPSGSFSTSSDIMEATDASPVFVVDAAGTFVFRANVSDGTDTTAANASLVVSARPTNTDPTPDAGPDQSAHGYATCSWTGASWSCSRCSGDTFTVDAGGSNDDDGDPLHYRWTTSSTYAAISTSDAESTTVRISNLPAVYGVDTAYTVTLNLLAVDCADGDANDTVDIVYTCTGI